MELHKKTEIKIISIENPSRFWFRTKENDRKLNAAIEEYMVSRLKANDQYVPQLNDMVVIVESKTSYIIGKISNFVASTSDEIWCTFLNGNVCRVKRHDITPLPNELVNNVIDTTLLGSIAGLVPVKMVSRKSEIIFPFRSSF